MANISSVPTKILGSHKTEKQSVSNAGQGWVVLVALIIASITLGSSKVVVALV